MAKYWIVSSSLFVPGRLMAPIRLQEEKAVLVTRKARLEAQLQHLPDRIADLDRQLSELSAEEYRPYKT